MAATLAESIMNALLGLELGSSEQDTGSRVALDGLTLGPGPEGTLAIGARRLEASSLRLASGPLTVEVGRLALHKLSGQVRNQAGRLRLGELAAASAELSGVKVRGPLVLPAGLKTGAQPARAASPVPAVDPTSVDAPCTTWCLGPLATADGTLRARITDAQLIFDADVTVPLQQGQVDFNRVTVEHVGPDSRMGVSRMGVYVDAPSGRSYLYQFPSTPVGGVEYERRGALLGALVSDRGRLRLQAFGEGLLRQGRPGQGLGLTEQARLLFGRTAVTGELRLGDGAFSAPGLKAELEGRAQGRNVIRVRSEAVGRGLALELPALAVRHAVWDGGGMRLTCDAITAALTLQVSVDRSQLHFAFEVSNMELSGLRLRWV